MLTTAQALRAPACGVAEPASAWLQPARVIPLPPSKRPPSPFPELRLRGARAVIYRPCRSATQGGRAGTKDWVLEFEPAVRPQPDVLMGWWGGGDTQAQVRLRFPTRESAERYAHRHGLDWTVIEPAQETLRPRFDPAALGAPADAFPASAA